MFGAEHWHCQIKRVRPRGNVFLMPGVTAPDMEARKQPCGPVIGILNNVVAQALKGEVQAVAIAWIDHNGADWRNWGGGAVKTSALLGALALVSEEITRKVNEGV